jgi:hypothetical protein
MATIFVELYTKMQAGDLGIFKPPLRAAAMGCIHPYVNSFARSFAVDCTSKSLEVLQK